MKSYIAYSVAPVYSSTGCSPTASETTALETMRALLLKEHLWDIQCVQNSSYFYRAVLVVNRPVLLKKETSEQKKKTLRISLLWLDSVNTKHNSCKLVLTFCTCRNHESKHRLCNKYQKKKNAIMAILTLNANLQQMSSPLHEIKRREIINMLQQNIWERNPQCEEGGLEFATTE